MRSHGLSGTNWSSHNAYHSDANGNVTALVNSSGVLVASYKYNPYGGLISSIGALASANTMRFSSKPAILSATGAWGFYYYGYRFYDPATGALSAGILFSPGIGLQTATAGTAAYLQATAARCVDDLTGWGAHVGAAFTPGMAIGADFLLQPKPGGWIRLAFS